MGIYVCACNLFCDVTVNSVAYVANSDVAMVVTSALHLVGKEVVAGNVRVVPTDVIIDQVHATLVQVIGIVCCVLV